MMKTNLTFLSKKCLSVFMIMASLLYWSGLNAQCSLGCSGQINVSLNELDCEAVVEVSQLLVPATTSCPDGSFSVELRHNGVLIPNATLTSAHVGKIVEGKVKDAVSGNSCWGWVKVEDKLAPTITCPDAVEVLCYEEASLRPIGMDNCDGANVRILLIDSTELVNNCSGTLGGNILKNVTKVYKAIDKGGMESAPCTLSYSVVKLPSLDIIDGPTSLIVPTDNNLLCDVDYELNSQGNPHPNVTGYPTIEINGVEVELSPDNDLFCNLIVTYQDRVDTSKACVTKIVRTWTVMEWACEISEPEIFMQLIDIADTNKPTISGLKNINATTSPHHCEALVTVPAAIVDDACSSVSVTISGGTPLIVGNGGKTSLPLGVHKLYYRVTDKCGNFTLDSIIVTVEDNTPPVAVCDQRTTVSVTTNGEAWVHAKVFDDGSYDECDLAKMLVRRMDNTCPVETAEFDDFYTLGTFGDHYYYLSRHKIEARLADKHGKALGGYLANFSSAAEGSWVATEARKINDTITYLAVNSLGRRLMNPKLGTNSAVSDTENHWYVVEIDVRNGWSSYAKFCCSDVGADQMVAFRVVDKACNFNDCMVITEVQDKIGPALTCPDDKVLTCVAFFPTGNLVADYGAYTATDNCPGELIVQDTIVRNTLTQCNNGELDRRITVRDRSGRSATCLQRIVVNPSYNDIVITVPANITLNACADPKDDMFKPAATGTPTITGDNQCSLIGVDYDDDLFTFNNSNGEACFKIIRKWKAIDWCSYNNTSGTYEYVWERTQTIVVVDKEKPKFAGNNDKKFACTYDQTCTDGFIELTTSATDNCTGALKYSYKIDVNNDGTFDAGFYKNQPLAAQGTGNSINASGTYPIGTHRIQYTFSDRCGNAVTRDQIFEVANCKAPTPYCLNGLAVDLMPIDEDNDGEIDGGAVELWASDFDRGSYHSCGYNVLLSFTPNVNVRNKVFTCDDFGRKDVTLYASVIVNGDTIQSFCNTFIDVQDNMGACKDMRLGISGNLATEMNKDVANATVQLSGAETMVVTSANDGTYDFGAMPLGGTYVVKPAKNDDHMNGVSTLDMVLIQRHILSIEKLNTPLKYIAADVNKDGRITASDLVELRKLILGVNNTFTNNTSWRFFDVNAVVPTGSSVLDANLPESYNVDLLNVPMRIDFTAVKVGDVNDNAVANITSGAAEARTTDVLELITKNTTFKAGENVSATISALSTKSLTGSQFTIVFDASKLSFNGITANDMNVTNANVGLSNVEQGIITFSWNEAKAVTVSELFTLNFDAKANGELASTIGVNSRMTKAEAYSEAGEVMDVTLRTSTGATKLELFQNVPNPFNEYTTISFVMPKKGEATVNILDVTGKTVYTKSETFESGLNAITINKYQHQLSGVMYYQLSFEGETLVKKMVVIE